MEALNGTYYKNREVRCNRADGGGNAGGKSGGKKSGGKDNAGRGYRKNDERLTNVRPTKGDANENVGRGFPSRKGKGDSSQKKSRKQKPFDDFENPFAMFEKKLKKANLPEGHARRKPKTRK